MSPGNKYQPYTAADILRYLQGEMTGKEMHQLELDALDDPFLQDAVDGYRLEWEKGNKEKLVIYSNEVLAKPATAVAAPARVVPFYSQRIFKYASAAVLLLGTGWIFFNQNDKTVQKEDQVQTVIVKKLTDSVPAGDVAIVKTPEDQAAPAPAMAKTDAPKYKSSEQPTVENNVIADYDISPALARTAPVEPPNLEGFKTNDKEIAANSKPASQVVLVAPMRSNFQTDTGRVKGVTDDNFNNVAFSKTEKASISQTAPKTDFTSPYYEEKKALSRYSISGKTVDKEKYPLENITLRVKGDTVATVSDELGRFQLNLRDSQATLVASGAGIETKEFLAKAKRGKVEVELEPSKSQMMQEAVVSSAYAKRSRRASQELDMDTADASPKGGWLAFTRYVERNKQVRAGKPPVYVVLSFEIDENGRLGAMDIIESGGKVYDKEAMRLLKKGPAWINKTKDKITFAKITIVL